MNTHKYLTMLLLSAIAASCSNSDTPEGKNSETLYETSVELGFTLSSATSTRTSRPLESSDGWQKVTDMRVYVFRSESGTEGTFTYYYPKVTDYRTGKPVSTPYFEISSFDKPDEYVWTYDEFETHTYSIDPLLPEGYYRFLAVGRDDNAEKSPLTINWTEGLTKWTEAMMRNNGGTPRVTEIFSGYATDGDGSPLTMHVSDNSLKLYSEITLRRAVAGVLLYVKNIPAKLTSEYAWQSEGAATGIITGGVNKGVECSVDEVAIVSVGYNPAADIMNRCVYGTEFISDNSRFVMTRIASVSTLGLTPSRNLFQGPLLDGSFVFPTELHDKKSFTADYTGGELANPGNFTVFDKSLYLCFFHISGSGKYYPLKMIPIRIAESATNDAESEGMCAGSLNLSQDGLNYNLVANHLYCLGVRNIKENIDEPLDLNDVLNNPSGNIITVIGNWQADIDIEM